MTDPPDDEMLAGMEGLIAVVKDRKPARPTEMGLDSTLLANEVDAQGRTGAPWEAEPSAAPLARGAVVGRYVVLHRLGAGAMGVVYAAYDPELDRKVAIKLLLPGVGGAQARTRLLREAQTLGKLSSPHVVAVHDVGTVGEQVWLAMELVRGQVLRQWLATPRRSGEVVRVLRSAGEGLAAAHAAGLLHRDFKPDNVMIGDDGRVRVMDFGLARVRPDATRVPEDERVRPTLDALALEVTKADATPGTPAYMAPEQHEGGELTPAADQFAFCVTLWEALYGERPFDGRSWEALRANVLAGRLRRPSRPRGVPAWLRAACERGLATNPQERWPSMRALLDVLATGSTRARVRRVLATLGVLALVGAGVEGYRRLELERRAAACEAAGDAIAQVWSREHEAGLRAALLATGSSLAETTADAVVPWLDAQASAWRDARLQTCLDTEVHGRWSAETHDRSLWCLDERRSELQSLVDELMHVDAALVHTAVLAAAELAGVAPCRDTRVLDTLPLPPAADREAIAAVRARVTKAGNMEVLGRHTEGLELARRALQEAQPLAWRPLSAAARVQLGLLLSETGAHAEAEATLEEAYFEASEGVAPEQAFNAASGLVQVVGVKAERLADGLRWGRHATVAAAALPGQDDLRRLRLATQLGNVYNVAGEPLEAAARYEEALTLVEAALGPRHPFEASVLNNLGRLHIHAGNYDQAEAVTQRALAIREEVLGPSHPLVASSLNNMAVLQQHRGNLDAAKVLGERALAIRERSLGPTHPEVASTLSNLGLLHHATGDYARARDFLVRAIAIDEQRLAPGHPRLAGTLQNLAMVHHATGQHDQARQLYERAIAIQEQALGPEHTDLALSLSNLGVVCYEQGELARARALHERALAITEKALGPEHPRVAKSLSSLADVLWETGAHDEAEGLYERAFAILERTQGPDHADTGPVMGRLARALRRRGSHAQAEALYRRELGLYEEALGLDHPDLADPLLSLAELAREGGRAAEAVPLAQRAVDLRERGNAGPALLAYARYALARALWDAPTAAGGGRTRALALATQSRDALLTHGYRGRELEAMEAWLAEHGEPPAAKPAR